MLAASLFKSGDATRHRCRRFLKSCQHPENLANGIKTNLGGGRLRPGVDLAKIKTSFLFCAETYQNDAHAQNIADTVQE